MKANEISVAKKQFLKDLQSDKDYLQHRQNCQWKTEKFSPYIPEQFYTVASGSFHVASVNNDIFKRSNF